MDVARSASAWKFEGADGDEEGGCPGGTLFELLLLDEVLKEDVPAAANFPPAEQLTSISESVNKANI